jgi:hypothetical protein
VRFEWALSPGLSGCSLRILKRLSFGISHGRRFVAPLGPDNTSQLKVREMAFHTPNALPDSLG